MPQGRISKRSVDCLICQAGKDREILWDDALAGFGVAAFSSGKKVYVAQYRKDGRSRRVSIGEHGRLTPDEARSMAKTILGQVEQGADPVEERRKARAVRTFREVAEDFIKLHVEPKRKSGTKADYEALLKRFIYPAIGSKRIMDIRRAEIAKLHAKLAEKPYTGNRVLALISSIWNWSAKRDEVEFAANPAKGIERNKERKRERFLGSEELARLGEILRLAETEGLEWTIDESPPKSKHIPKNNRRTKIDQHAAAAIRLLIFTGARLREILHAKWEQVDFERSIIHLPDSKTGAKPIYLSVAALDILRDLPRIEGNPHIIPGENQGAPRSDLKKPWSAVTKAAGIEGTRIHDLRHSFASFGAGASLGLPIIGKLLGHSQAATTHRYAHLDADPMHKAANTIGGAIAAAMSARSPAVAERPKPTVTSIKNELKPG
ncbi:site-specific integrase [Rhodoblastus sp.]|uniref:tyrosine-type recombinase/integrase n=1 Tax=Rhodoblastus sp. TaxID=1962975 RepID=UPI0025F272F0|nr:site-specific integrase [Rhodoblastus sp.]